jgi:uncharacterized protein YjbI with pentapeptide repeats/DNA-binding transcriptional MerR regulator
MSHGFVSSWLFREFDTVHIIGITRRQLDYWSRTGLVCPSVGSWRGPVGQRRYSYRSLLQLRTIKTILDAGISLEEARRAIGEFGDWQDGDMARSNMVIREGSVAFHRIPHGIDDLRCDRPVNLRVLSLAGLQEGLDRRIRSLGRVKALRVWNAALKGVEDQWKQLVRTAYHEAGHAVVARVLDQPVISLTIKPHGPTGSRGRVVFRENAPSMTVRLLVAACSRRRRNAKHYLLVTLAGPLAESMKSDETGNDSNSGGGGDFAAASTLLEFLHPELRRVPIVPDEPRSQRDIIEESRKRLWDRAWNECRELLNRPEVWEWVEAVAEAALTYETLDGNHIDSLNPSRTAGDSGGTRDRLWGHLPHPDFAGVNWAGADLSGHNLAGANLTGANLAGANLRRVNLKGAYLFGANLTDATLIEADLTDANLEWSMLKASNLDGATLRCADLTRANLTQASLRNTSLPEVNLIGTNLRGAEITGASLSAAVADLNTVWPDGFNPADAGVLIFTP